MVVTPRFAAIGVLCCLMLPAGAQAGQPSLEEFYRAQHKSVQFTPPAVPESDKEAAQEKPVAGSHVVTSVSKCFEDLGAEESAEIKKNSLTPYADCQKRLRERALEKKAERKEPVAETPRNYRRIIEDANEEGGEAAQPAAPAKAAKKK